MELLYIVAFCIAGIVSATKGVSYYYPPVYGTHDEVDYADANAESKTNRYQEKAVTSYHKRQPAYSQRRRPSYPQSRTEVQQGLPPFVSPRQQSAFTARQERSRYKQPEVQEQIYLRPARRDERRYYKPAETEERVYFKPAEREEPTYYKPAETEERTYYKEPAKAKQTYYKAPTAEEAAYYQTPKTDIVSLYKAPEEKSFSKKTQKCFQCEYSPPKPITYEVLVREPYKVQVPKTVHECEWEKTIEYIYQKPKRGSSRMYGQYKEVPKYEKICFPKTVFETKTKYRSRYVKKQKVGNSGGFEACKGPLDEYKARKSGVDDWDCHNNCYVKKDKEGTVTRGCYSGQYKVDPDRLGCHHQGDTKQDLYCFCTGDHCNGKLMPASTTYG